MLPLDQLRSSISRAEMLAWMLDKLHQLGFQTASWIEGRIQQALIQTSALVGSDATEVVKTIANMGFNDFASGDLLTEYSRSRFDNDRQAAVRMRGPMMLTSTATVPYTIAPGDLTATTDDGILFRNLTGGVLGPQRLDASTGTTTPNTLQLQWEAVLAGALVVPNGAVKTLVKPLAGVTIANDTKTPWHDVAGLDEESDEILRLRNRTKWATLTPEFVRDTYVNIALNNGARKVVVHDLNPRGPFTLDIYCAGEVSPLGASDLRILQGVFASRALQTDSAWPPAATSRVIVRQPGTALLDINATLYHDANIDPDTVKARARVALTTYLRETPIGGWDYRPGPYNIIQREDLVDVLKDVEGVKTVSLGAPVESFLINAFDLLIAGTWNLTAIAVYQ